MTAPTSPYLDALQAAVAGEQAAVWASGRAAGELQGDRREEARQEVDEHRRARDDLRRQVIALGAEPVAAAAAYVEPFPVVGARGGRRLLAHVNSGLAATYADLAAASAAGARRDAAMRSSRAAVRAFAWGADPEAFPGA